MRQVYHGKTNSTDKIFVRHRMTMLVSLLIRWNEWVPSKELSLMGCDFLLRSDERTGDEVDLRMTDDDGI